MLQKKRFRSYESVLARLFLLLFVVFSVASKHFLSVGNVLSMFSQMVELGLLTMAMTASIVSGGMDLSVGALASLCTVLLSTLIGVLNWGIWPSLLAVLLFAVLCGLLNGFLIGYLKVTAMLATLGTQSLFTGLGMVISKGSTVSLPNKGFALFGQYKIGGVVPFQIVILLLAGAAAVLLFDYSRWGRRVYLIGNSMEASRFAGINRERNLMLVYLYSAVMSFLAAVVIASRISSGRADVADAMVLQTVSAAVFGGISIKGGSGKIAGAILGVAVFTIISNGMNMLRASQFLQQVIIGSILLMVLAARSAQKKIVPFRGKAP